ncbi:GNAT family N-acetyltransferase [Streptomyces canus]|uniref:GNAT family N-acetyltransferase n=1 Tax=Streptomyces canus TaxID=58343 RepID=UPI0030E25C58
MPQLTLPDVRFHASYLHAVREFTEAGLDPAVLESGEIGPYGRTWREPAGFAAFMLEFGGHIGYVVRPGARRRGHATAMLAAALPVCRQLGIARALVTCDAGNTASRKVIEANGGEFEDRRGVKLRYWIRTGN